MQGIQKHNIPTPVSYRECEMVPKASVFTLAGAYHSYLLLKRPQIADILNRSRISALANIY